MNLFKIHHIAIIVSDYEAAKDFYVNKLGFSVIRENYRSERKDWKLDLRVNEYTELEIFAEENPPKRVNRPEACGLRHLAFCVESVEQTVKELAEVGIECEPIRVDDYTDKKMTFFHDPDGLRADTARRALPWLEKALNGGLSDAAKNLYNLFSGSEGFPRDRGRQWEIALRGASAGNPYWEERCGKMCREENGREAEAMRWFRQAAHHGQASSWFHIGSHYERGLGVDKDPAKAAEAYRNGAEKGSSDAQQALGVMAAFGRGVPQDPAQAAYWLRLAADDEKPLACGVLGHCYLRGLGVQQDDGEAFALLDRFAEAYDREKPDDGETSTYPDELVGP